ncbi:MAG: hypothetical protein GF313_04160 [Caldithrix sp.]|nr:hypothetical protein [Caldithrix sp.]
MGLAQDFYWAGIPERPVERNQNKIYNMSWIYYFVGAIVGFFLLMQIIAVLSNRLKKGREVTGITGKVGQKVEAGERLLLYFYSQSCSACRSMTPIVEKMQNKHNNVFKVDVMQDRNTPHALGIMGTPTTVLIDQKRIVAFHMGAKNATFLQKLLQN